MIKKPDLKWNADNDVVAVKTYIVPFTIGIAKEDEDIGPCIDPYYIDDIALVIPVYLYNDVFEHIPDKLFKEIIPDVGPSTDEQQEKIAKLQLELFNFNREAAKLAHTKLLEIIKEMTRGQTQRVFFMRSGAPIEIDASIKTLDAISIIPE